MRGLFVVGQARKQIKGGKTLAGGRDIILLALDDFHGNGCDLADVNLMASDDKCVLRNLAVLENAFDGRQIKL